MSIFLCLSQRYHDALKTYDPLKNEWLIGLLDPWQRGKERGSLAWGRIALIALIAFIPMLLFSAVPSITCGGLLLGKGSFLADVGIWGITFYIVSTLMLVPIMRRVLGDLFNELGRRGSGTFSGVPFNPKDHCKGRFIRFLERWSRLDRHRGKVWFLICFIDQVSCYVMFLADGKPTWHTSPATPGTFFYFARIGNEQPNLAGLWDFMVFGPLGVYLVFVIARLIIVFACQCSALALNPNLKIDPTHPDGTGGLKPVGQVALLFAVFTFILGVDLTAMITNELIVNLVFHPDTPLGGTNVLILYGLCGLYLSLGSALFFMPLLPLREKMADHKRRYLMHANNLYAVAGRKHFEEACEEKFQPESLQGLSALHTTIRSAEDMAVWPFDRKTFLRYAGLLLAPLTPIVSRQIPQLLVWIKGFVGWNV